MKCISVPTASVTEAMLWSTHGLLVNLQPGPLHVLPCGFMVLPCCFTAMPCCFTVLKLSNVELGHESNSRCLSSLQHEYLFLLPCCPAAQQAFPSSCCLAASQASPVRPAAAVNVSAGGYSQPGSARTTGDSIPGTGVQFGSPGSTPKSSSRVPATGACCCLA